MNFSFLLAAAEKTSSFIADRRQNIFLRGGVILTAFCFRINHVIVDLARFYQLRVSKG